MTGFGTSDELIRRYINPGNPLGPIDTDLIEHDAVKAELFDPHYASFNKLLSRDVNVVIGRRGAGKTALLNCYRHRWFLKNTEARGSFAPSFDLSDYNLVFFTPVHTAFETLQLSVMGANQIVRPIESVVSSWDALISDFLLLKIVESTDTNKAPECATILQYLGRQDTIDRQEAHDAIWGTQIRSSKWKWGGDKREPARPPPTREQAMAAAEMLLKEMQCRALLILDSMDQYQVGDESADRTIGALMRFVRGCL